MEAKTIVAGILIAMGCFFVVVASIGLLRFPDFYSRIHPAGKADTLGKVLIMLGLTVYEGFSIASVKLLIVVAFVFIANPTAIHSLAKAAYVAGLKPWDKSRGETRW